MAQQVAFGNFDPVSDSVDIAGTFNGWGSSLEPLADADGDTVYTVVLDGFAPGEFIEYKFRINGQWDGTEEFPGVGSNRLYTVQADGNLIDVWYNDFAPGGGHGAGGETFWWNDAVFYEIFVRSYCDSDGDGIGDLAGLTSKLDYLNDGDAATTDDLGVTGIWLMPINDSPSYHGYDATDYRGINPDYGTLADFEAFLAAAHARGIKVIVDYVMNHCSNQHPWFVASRTGDPTYRDWFRWQESDPGESGPWGQQVWHWNDWDYYYGLFWSGMPDLNYENAALKAEMFDTASWWLDTVGVDGFRLDAVLYIDEDPGQLQSTPQTLQFWQDFNLHVKGVEPDVLSVGEAWTATSTVVQYVIDDRLDFCFEFDLSYAMMGAASGGDADYLAGKAAQVYGTYPYLQYGTFLTNHDQDRSFTVLGEDAAKAKVAAGLYLLQPGIPFLYYGEEIGMTGSGAHEWIRTPMQWSPSTHAGFSAVEPWHPVNGDFIQYNVTTEDLDPNSLLNWYRTLIHARNGSPALRRGTFTPLTDGEASVMSFLRSDGQQTVLCLANTSPSARHQLALGVGGTLETGQFAVVDLLGTGAPAAIEVLADGSIAGVDLDGQQVYAWELTRVVGVGDGQLPRTGLRLEQVHPNPFNPATTIRYSLDRASPVRVGVYDVAGREIALLVNEVQETGRHQVRWEGVDGGGQAVGAGVYFVRIVTPDQTRRTKMTLLK